MLTKKRQNGFTVVELLIATTVFSIVLIAMVYAVLFVSDNFLRGEIEGQTQSNIGSVEQQISQQIQLAGASISPFYKPPSSGGHQNTVVAYKPPASLPNGPGPYFICLGNERYTFTLDTEQSSPPAPAVFTSQYVANCTSSINLSGTSATTLLAKNMLLSAFNVIPQGNNLYAINIQIAYGSQFDPAPNAGGRPLGAYNYSCDPSILSGFFCAVSTLNTVVGQRVVN